MKTVSTDNIQYTEEYGTYDYEPKGYLGALDWFNIARCARERMTERCLDMHAWRGERRSFYIAIRMMDADSKYLLD
jgi:hypothetical protein